MEPTPPVRSWSATRRQMPRMWAYVTLISAMALVGCRREPPAPAPSPAQVATPDASTSVAPDATEEPAAQGESAPDNMPASADAATTTDTGAESPFALGSRNAAG